MIWATTSRLARKIRDQSTDAALLTAVAIFSLAHGVRYLPTSNPEPLPHGLGLVASVFGTTAVVTIYAVTWLIAAAAAVVGMARPQLYRFAYWPAYVIALLSFAFYLVAWASAIGPNDSPSADYLNDSKYLFVALVIRTRWYAMKKAAA